MKLLYKLKNLLVSCGILMHSQRSSKAVLTILLVTFLSFQSYSSHFRYGSTTWQWQSGRTVKFKVSQAWRKSAFGNVALGNTVGVGSLNFGDGTAGNINLLVTAVNNTEDWFYGECLITKTYTVDGNYIANFSSCCRISTLMNNADGSENIQTRVNIGTPFNSSPSSTLNPIVNLATGQTNASFLIPANDPDGNALTYRLANSTEMGGGSNPAGFSVNSTTGAVTFNTVGKTVGSLWSAAVVVSDGRAEITLDFIIKITNTSTAPYFNYAITPSNATTYKVSPGQNISFSVNAADVDAGDNVSLQVIGMPAGATITPVLPASGNPVQATFSWTPTASQLGVVVLNFIAQDNSGVQKSTSVNINVNMNPIFVVPPTPALNYVKQVETGVLYTETITARNPDPNVTVSIISVSGLPAGVLAPALPTPSSNVSSTQINWTPVPSDFGQRTISFVARDPNNNTTTHSYGLIINTPPVFTSVPPTQAVVGQQYSYLVTGFDANIPYGDQLDFHGITIPSWLTLTPTGNGTALLQGTPSGSDVGTNAVELEAADIYHHGGSAHVEQAFDIEVSLGATISYTGSTSICKGDSLLLSANVGLSNSYQWYKNGVAIAGAYYSTFSVADSGYYQVEVTNGAYTALSDSVEIKVKELPKATVGEFNSFQYYKKDNNYWVCPGSMFYLGYKELSYDNRYSFEWSNLLGHAILDSINPFIHVTADGYYALDVTLNGCTKRSDTLRVLFLDPVPPTVVTKNITVALDSYGFAFIQANQVDSASIDLCGIDTMTLDRFVFSCSDLGPNLVTLFVTDVNGNVSTGHAIVTVIDTIAPIAIAKDTTVFLDMSGNVIINSGLINFGSTDSCGIDSMYVVPSEFTCANVGHNQVVLFVRDNFGNISTDTAIVTVKDVIAPLVQAKDTTVYLDGMGKASISGNHILPMQFDACGIDSVQIFPSQFTCSNVGKVPVIYRVVDPSGNDTMGIAMVTVLDKINPTVLTKNISVKLNSSGIANVLVSDINNGSFDNCGIDTLYLSKEVFTCSDVGVNSVQLTVVDVNGNSTVANALVTVRDTIAPNVLTQNLSINLSASGSVSISAHQIDAGSSDACLIDTMFVTPSSFNCVNVGDNTVTLTVKDVNGNVSTKTAVVSVKDVTAPVVVTKDLSISLDATGAAVITASQIDNGSSDACGIASLSLSKSSFDCSNVGTNTITLTVTDVNGNVSSATAVVTITDVTAPLVVTQNLSISLNASGMASITTSQINNGSSDACGIATINLDKTNFTCSNVGANTVILTVTDVNGNVASGTAVVTITDVTSPVVITQNLSVSLGAAGTASITAAQINNGSSDACGIATINLDKTNFTCSNVGDNTVTLTVIDVNGNVSSATAVVTISDVTAPVVVTKDLSILLDATGAAVITASQIDNGSSDACGIASLSLSKSSFDCSNVGINTITLTVTDVNGNVSSAIAVVTITDVTAPVVVTQNLSISLDASGMASITTSQINNGSSDACGIASLSLSKSSFDCSNVGANTVILTVTDVNGNVASGTAVVTIADVTAPVVITQNLSVSLSAAGTASITASQINNGSSDACGVATISLDKTNFTCSNVGANTVTLTVTDINGNSSAGTSVVTIRDVTAPIAVAQNVTISLNASGTASIQASQIDNGSSDVCGIASLSLSKSTFNCSNIGANTVTLTVTDVNGNSSVASSVVTVVDDIAPSLIAPPSISKVNNVGVCFGTTLLGSATVSDNCSYTLSNNAPATFPIGTTTVTWTATDASGNVSSSTQLVSISNTTPVINSISANVAPIAIVNAASASAIFTDNNVVDAVWNWGDGSVSTGSIINQTVSGSHLYSTAGVYSISLTITDACGEVATLGYNYIVIYEPNGGFVTGGGWIDSPAGAYIANPTLTGKANFGFVSKYQNGANVPTGNTEFQFKAGNLNFKSSSFEWLVVAGAKAQFKGEGTINNAGLYSFFISAIDGGSTDKFRIRIWDKVSGGIVYDNNMGGSEYADPTTIIAGGNIVVHKSGNARYVEDSETSESIVSAVHVYPNPSNDAFNVSIESVNSEDVQVNLFDITGTLLKSYSHVSPAELLVVDNTLNAGVYLIEVIQGEYRKTIQVVKTK